MKITTKMIAAFTFAMTVLFLAQLYQNDFGDRVRRVVDRDLTERGFGTGLSSFQLLEDLRDLEEFSLKFLVSDDPLYRERMTEVMSSVEGDLRTLRQINLTGLPEELDQIIEEWGSAQHSLEGVIAVSARTPERDKQRLSGEIRTSLAELQESTTKLIEVSQAEIERQVERTRELASQVILISWISLLVAMTVTVAVCFYVYWLFSDFLQKLIKGTRAIAAGDFEIRLDESGGDELAEFARYLNRMSARLGEADRIKREFISHLSHDLTAPLASMQETTRLLLDSYSEALDATQKKLLTLNLNSSNRLSKLVHDLLDSTTLQAGVMGFDLEPVNLPELLRESVNDHFGLCQQKGLRIDLRLPDACPVIRGDRIRLAQLFGNLLSNAIKFSPEGGVIVIEVDLPDASRPATERQIRVVVSDNGPGVPDLQKEQIFSHFNRGVKSTSSGQVGTGLGLAISRGIAEAMGGTIWVEDNPTGGARFVFELPVSTF